MGTIQSCQMAIGYLSPGQRDSCRTCAHALKVPVHKHWTDFGCGLYGFSTPPMAICNKYERKAAPKAGHGLEGGAA